MKSCKYGSFKIYVDGEFLMTFRGFHGDLLELLWPIHYEDPQADIEIIQDAVPGSV